MAVAPSNTNKLHNVAYTIFSQACFFTYFTQIGGEVSSDRRKKKLVLANAATACAAILVFDIHLLFAFTIHEISGESSFTDQDNDDLLLVLVGKHYASVEKKKCKKCKTRSKPGTRERLSWDVYKQ